MPLPAIIIAVAGLVAIIAYVAYIAHEDKDGWILV